MFPRTILSRQIAPRHLSAADRKARRKSRLGLESLETRQVLSTFAVTNLADSGAGSLRQAVTQADAASDYSVIAFNPGLSGTLSLKSALPELSNTRGIAINGDNNVTIDLTNAKLADGSSLKVDAGVPASINNLTLTNAPGRAVENYGTLSMSSDTIQNSHNGAVVNYGTLTLYQDSIQNNTALNYGGGVNNYQGSLNSVQTNFTGNKAGSGPNSGLGGAIENDAKLTVSGGTFSGNSAGDGGAIHDSTTTPTTIDSATITGNTAGLGGGLYVDDAALQLQNSNVYGNHANAAGFGGVGADVYTDSSLASTSFNNVIGDGSGLWGISDNNPFDRPHVAGSTVNPQFTYNASKPVNYIGTHASPIAPVMEQVVSFEGTKLTYDYTVRTNSATLTIAPGSQHVWLDAEMSDDNQDDNNAHYYPNNFAVDLYLSDSGNDESGSISLWQNYDITSLAQPSLTITGGNTGTNVSNGLSGLSYTWNGAKH